MRIDDMKKLPPLWLSAMPLITLVALIIIVLIYMPDDALSGASQLALIVASSVCVAISMLWCHTPWETFEEGIKKTVGDAAISILILLMIGVMSRPLSPL